MNWLMEAERLDRLSLDLRLISANSDRPTIDQLAMAPVLSDWRRAVVANHALIGCVRRHPLVGPGPIRTSAIVAEGPGWARTLSRFYVLQDAHPSILD